MTNDLNYKIITINSICSNITPLTKLLRCLCERHVGRNCRVNNSLRDKEECNFNCLQSR